MTTITLWHNPRCSKSREALTLLRERGVEPTVVDYRKQPPTPAQLRQVLALLSLPARALVRSGEAEFAALGLDRPELDDEALVTAMAGHPILIQRPLAFSADRAVIGRPPERVLELLDTPA